MRPLLEADVAEELQHAPVLRQHMREEAPDAGSARRRRE
jgi:hypothetical protein